MWIAQAPLFFEYMQNINNRLNKLQSMATEKAAPLIDLTLSYSMNSFKLIRVTIDDAWNLYDAELKERGDISELLSRVTSGPYSDGSIVEHDISSILNFVREVQRHNQSSESSKVPVPVSRRPTPAPTGSTGAELCLHLLQEIRGATSNRRSRLVVLDTMSFVERSVQSALPRCEELFTGDDRETTALLDLLAEYLKEAKSQYEGLPLETSTMALTGLALVAMADFSACKWDKSSVWRTFAPPVDLLALQLLLLPRRQDLETLDWLESYFASRRTNPKADMFDFGVRGLAYQYCIADQKMQDLRLDSLRVQSKREQQKREEYRKIRKRAEDLKARIDECEEHEEECKCADCKAGLQNQLDHCNLQIYERDLPETLEGQYAVLFFNQGPHQLLAAIQCIALLEETLHGTAPAGGATLAALWEPLIASRTTFSNKSFAFGSFKKDDALWLSVPTLRQRGFLCDRSHQIASILFSENE
jgi:hypothetical protein